MAKLAEATLVLKVDSREYDLAIKQMPKDADKAATSIRGISQAVNFAVFKELASIATSALKTVGGAFAELVTRGAEVQGIETAFSNLTVAIGETKDSMLETSRDATKGLIADFDLMAAGNKALLLGVPVTSESFGTMAKAATVLGRAMGHDATKSFDDLITALGRSQPLILDNLGITVSVGKANEAYAKVLGTTAAALTDADKKQAFYNAAMAEAAVMVAAIGDIQLTLADQVLIARNTFQNFTDALGVAINQSPVFAAGMAAMGKALGEAFGSDQKEQASELTAAIEEIAINLTYVGQGAVVVGTVFATVFSAMGVLVNGALTAVVGFAGGIVTTLDSMAKLAAALPFASDGTKALAASFSELKTDLDAMTVSLKDSTKESAKGVIGQGELHEKLDAMGGVILRVRDAMVEAQGATAGVTKATVDLGKAAPEAVARSQDAAAKIAEAFAALNAEVVAGTKIGLEKRLFEINAAKEKELAGLANLKELTVGEHANMELLINEKYQQRVAAAKLAGDEIAAKEREVQDQIALSLTTGTENKLLQIDIARDKEIEALAFLKAVNEQRYAEDVAAVNEKYAIQTAAARGYYANIELAAAAAGFKTRAELQDEADNAKRLYAEMLASGEFTYSALEAAKEKATAAAKLLDEQAATNSIDKFDLIASSASTMLRSIFGQNKTAAIAAAIIDTAAAVVSSFRNAGGFPWGLIPAAAMAAAGAAQIRTIRSQDAGFAQGTPGLDFMDFGAQSFQPLHNQEAVIPRGGGHMLAGEIADSMPGSDEQLSLLRNMSRALDQLPLEMRKAFRNAMILDMA